MEKFPKRENITSGKLNLENLFQSPKYTRVYYFEPVRRIRT
jgi:hypothetical protein